MTTEQLVKYISFLAISFFLLTGIILAETSEEWVSKGDAFCKDGRYNDALNCYDKALEINPANFEAWNNKGWIYFNIKNYDEAINCFNKALEINPLDGNAWNNKGSILKIEGKYDEAIKCYDKALEINSLFTSAWNNKGKTLATQGKYKEAIKCYDKALEIDPSYKTAKMNREEAISMFYDDMDLKDAHVIIKILEPDMKKIKSSSIHITGLATSDNGIVKVMLGDSEARLKEVSEKYKSFIPSSGKTVQFEGEAFLTTGDNKIKIVAVDKSKSKKEQLLAIYREDDGNTGSSGIDIKKPSEGVIKTSDNRITLEGMVYTKKGIGLFEIYGVTGEDKDKADWNEKSPKATGKTEYYFSKDVELKAGINFIVVRMVDNGGKEVKKEIKVVYEPKSGEKWAVVIGIGKYESPKVKTLEYSDKDAKSIYDYLVTKGGFQKDHVKLLTNEEATLKNVKTAMGKFLQEKAMKDDLVFIYYSGHGAPEINPHSKDSDGLSKYIITYDADPDNLFATALPMEDIGIIFGRIISKKIVFFIDSCYSGAGGGKTFSGSGIKAGNISDKFLNDLSSGSGRLIITASSANEVALESEKLGHGIFTYYLLQGLAGGGDLNKNGFVTTDELYQYLYEKVSKGSDNRQHPSKKGESEGEIILVKGKE